MKSVDKSGIYCIENKINNKKYIGQAIDIEKRWVKHKSALNNNNHDNDYLQKSWNKYGSNSFEFYVLKFCDIDKLDEYEIYYIDVYKTLDKNKGYNLISGGNCNKKYSLETRKKISDALLGHEVSAETRKKVSENHANVSGENNPMYGKHHTNEARKKMSDLRKGVQSPRRNTTAVFCVELNKKFKDATEASKELSIDSSAVLKVCRGERKTCGGYHWKFIELENNIS